MSASAVRILLPPVPPLGRELVLNRLVSLYPDLPKRAKLYWARPNRASESRVTYRNLTRAEAWLQKDSTRMAGHSAPHLRGAAVEYPVPPAEGVVIPRHIREQFARGAATLDLVMAEAMGLVFDGMPVFRRDPLPYLLLPRQRPEGVPPMGLYVCGGLLHIFVSEQDIPKVAGFIGPGVSRFLDATRDDMRVMWHLFTPRPLALGGTKQAVEATGLPSNEGFVVWQWFQGGLLCAARYSRDAGEPVLLALDGHSPVTTWKEAAEFLREAQHFGRIPAPSVWKLLARREAEMMAGAESMIAPSKVAAPAATAAIPGRPETPISPIPAPLRQELVEPASRGGNEGGVLRVFDAEVVETPNAASKVEKPAKPVETSVHAASSQRPRSVPPASTQRPPGPQAPDPAATDARIQKLKQRISLALAVGNPAEVASLQRQLDALQDAR